MEIIKAKYGLYRKQRQALHSDGKCPILGSRGVYSRNMLNEVMLSVSILKFQKPYDRYRRLIDNPSWV